MQCGATLTLVTAIEQAAHRGDVDTVVEIAGRMRAYMAESSIAWCQLHEAVDDTHQQAVRMLADGATDEALWALFAGLSDALKQIQGHLALAREIHLTATELETLEALD